MTFFLLSVICAGAATYSFYFLFNLPNQELSKSRVSIGGKVFAAERAETFLEMARGLSGRDGLPDGLGMLFVFPRSARHRFWMRGMKFPIDIVWIRGEKVVGFAENMQPEPGKAMWSLKIYYPPGDVDLVLEINAGAVEKYGLRVGDPVVIK